MRKRKAGVGLLLLAAGLWMGRAPILRGMAEYLVQPDAPRKADVIIVLGGGANGGRILKACELARQGFAQKIWASGVYGFYGHWESDMAVDFAAGKGCPAPALVALHNQVDSTQDEARMIGQQMRAAGYHSYILVTSNYHTRRARRLFQHYVPDLEVIVAVAEDNEFSTDHWWEKRTEQKIFFTEWVKTVTSWIGI